MKNKHSESGAYAGILHSIHSPTPISTQIMMPYDTLMLKASYMYSLTIIPQSEGKNIPETSKTSNLLEYTHPTKDEIYIPVHLFNKNSTLQVVVLFLKNKGFRYNEIALMLNRDQRTIWCTYSKAMAAVKHIADHVSGLGISVPISIFSSRNLSVLENLVFYLRSNQDLSFIDISRMLGKNYRTIWTIYRRAMHKIDHD